MGRRGANIALDRSGKRNKAARYGRATKDELVMGRASRHLIAAEES